MFFAFSYQPLVGYLWCGVQLLLDHLLLRPAARGASLRLNKVVNVPPLKPMYLFSSHSHLLSSSFSYAIVTPPLSALSLRALKNYEQRTNVEATTMWLFSRG